MKNLSKAEDFSHREKSSRNEYEMIIEVLARGKEKTKFIGLWMLDAQGWMLVRS
ncbi:MAG: hypothetical protein WAV28_17785 [Sedimentisphaerales bacterium]